MEYTTLVQNFFRDITLSIRNHRNVVSFIKKNQLWKGMLQYQWVAKFLIIVGIVLGFKLSSMFMDWWRATESVGMSFAAVGDLIGRVASEGYNLFVMGGFKYVVLILMEVVIFHFARKTLEVLTGEKADASMNAFIEAQKRMIKVVIFSFVMEIVFSFIAKALLNFVWWDFLDTVVVFLIQCFFLGFAVIDNYNEIYKMTIRQSFKYTRDYIGVAISVGFLVYLLMLLPVVGTLLGPLLGAVTATITMHQLNEQDEKMEEVFV